MQKPEIRIENLSFKRKDFDGNNVLKASFNLLCMYNVKMQTE